MGRSFDEHPLALQDKHAKVTIMSTVCQWLLCLRFCRSHYHNQSFGQLNSLFPSGKIVPLFKTAAVSLFWAEIDVSERRHSYTCELLAKLRQLV